ncbi:hypothetical protein EVAR_98545_1 [Eumeta japonica]|uniref:Uncharacterized protein n=1 Tax=Eumeta variegata TaxID=151549 RepID=A0A4C1YMX3_EUMVA|nr:hypothetical protein EVAR_98545_1 [Eumeta japonica]
MTSDFSGITSPDSGTFISIAEATFEFLQSPKVVVLVVLVKWLAFLDWRGQNLRGLVLRKECPDCLFRSEDRETAEERFIIYKDRIPQYITVTKEVAVKACNIRMVQSLVSLKCSTDNIDNDGNTVYHYAAASNKEIITALANNSAPNLNLYNNQGYTPLHMACLANAPECVRALLLAGADVNFTADKGVKSTTTLPEGRSRDIDIGGPYDGRAIDR